MPVLRAMGTRVGTLRGGEGEGAAAGAGWAARVNVTTA
jgi:hypothetical protein